MAAKPRKGRRRKPSPPLTRKPLPHSPKVWEAECLGVVRLVASIDSLEADQGSAWAASMRDYYYLRLLDLLTHPPKAVLEHHPIRKWRLITEG